MATPSPPTHSSASTLVSALHPSSRHTFMQPTPALFDASLAFAKGTLDGLAEGVWEDQNSRIKIGGKRKRGGDEDFLRIRKVHTEGFAVEQVWEQARRVIDAARREVERSIEGLGDTNGAEKKKDAAEDALKRVTFGEDGLEAGSEDESEIETGKEDGDGGEEMMDIEGAETPSSDEDIEMDGANMDGLLHELEGEDDYDDDEEEDEEEDEEDDIEAVETFLEDPHGLNDGFFAIDEFNKQTEFLEQQDAAADPYTGEASDEEDIDWDVDPMAIRIPAVSASRRATAMELESDEEKEEDDDDNEEDEDEDGPTFGNVDLNAPEGDSENDEAEAEDDDDVGAEENTNDILYKDFFEPPPRKIAKGELQANYLARKGRKPISVPEDNEADVGRAIADVRRDLFNDLSEHEDSEDAISDLDPSDPKSRKSAHERRQTKLLGEIRRLEAASVAKREWTLSGEARAADRPINSLLEEDLDFERTGKPVPVITAAVSESIEELIKRRILALQFDEVIRRRPDADSVRPDTRRGAFELDDNKAQQSLAEIYEEEHVKNTNPDTYVSKEDEKLKKQQAEIEALWKDVSAKLDALSSWHYKPKPPAPSLTVVADVKTISMEDAQPTTGGGERMLAPQEVYAAGKEKADVAKGEVVLKSAIPVAKVEMSREEKLRRRRREKERLKKRGGLEGERNKKEGKRLREKRDVVGELKKGGVKVIGKSGDVKDIEGNQIKDRALVNGAGGYKL